MQDFGGNLISVDSMAYSILMIPASPFVGAVGDLFGQAGAGLALLGVLTAASGAAVLAKRLERYGVDAIIAEGTESGGHVGEMTTMALVPPARRRSPRRSTAMSPRPMLSRSIRAVRIRSPKSRASVRRSAR